MTLIDPHTGRVLLPAYRKLYLADRHDADTLEKFQDEPMVDVYMEPEQCRDFLVDRASGQIIPQVKSITINGIQWDLVPGKNRVPASVYEFMLQCDESARLSRQPRRSRCIAIL